MFFQRFEKLLPRYLSCSVLWESGGQIGHQVDKRRQERRLTVGNYRYLVISAD